MNRNDINLYQILISITILISIITIVILVCQAQLN